MATPVKYIEKDFLLKVLYDDQLPLIYLRDRIEYILTLERPSKMEEIFLVSHKPIPGLKIRKKLSLIFDFRGKTMSFSMEVKSIRDNHIVAEMPEFLYKNLDRSFLRVAFPPDMQVQFILKGDRYALSFPQVKGFEFDGVDDTVENLDSKNFGGLLEQIAVWLKDKSDGHKLVLFKEDIAPTEIEERLLAEMGKAIFLPSTQMPILNVDPFPGKRLVTEGMLKRFLENDGVAPAYLDEAISRFTRSKCSNGVLSDLWMPILFQEYVIGYIHVWINKPGKPPLDYETLETLYQFTRILSFSLKINGYFEKGKLQNEPFEGNVIDISASGLLFAYPANSSLAASLLPNKELLVSIITAKRKISARVKIVRLFKDNTIGYFGCHFLDMVPEDIRFLFEFIYGKPFTDKDATFLAGQV
jgi:hypothetical protein